MAKGLIGKRALRRMKAKLADGKYPTLTKGKT